MTTTSEMLQNPGDFPFLIACLAALFVGMSKGGVPTIGMTAVPVISLVMPPIKGAAVLLPIFILSDMSSVLLYRRSFSVVNLKILIPAGVLGVGIGWATASLVSDQLVALMIGIIGVLFCLYFWFGKINSAPAQAPTLRRGLFWGTLAGFTSFISHAGSPPYQMYVIPQKLEKLTFIGTTALVFAVINLIKVIPYSQLRPYSTDDLMLALWLAPIALLGTLCGVVLIRQIADFWFFRLIQVGLLLVSIRLIFQSF